MNEPRCWLCNRKMKLYREREHWRLWCSPCAASYIGMKSENKDAFLLSYARFYAEKRGNGQMLLSLQFDTEVNA